MSSKKESRKEQGSSAESDSNLKMEQLVKQYLEKMHTFPENVVAELEVKFGTRSAKPITKISFGNVIKSLQNFGFKCEAEEQYMLRIMMENTDEVKTQKISNIRTEINGFSNIQNYCVTNNLPEQLDDNYSFTNKQLFTNAGATYYPVNFDDFNFRMTFNTEEEESKTSEQITAMITNWKHYKKIFRYIKRYRFVNPKFPFLIDISIVKSSTNKYGKMISHYNIKDSEIFNNPEKYEIEFEIDNKAVGMGTPFMNTQVLIPQIRRMVKYVLIGLQDSHYPIGQLEQFDVLNNYFVLIKKQNFKDKPVAPTDFIGPSSVTVQMDHLQNLDEDQEINSSLPNIRKNYTVTDKADGHRKLMFIVGDGKIYLINTRMDVEFTGAITKNEELFNTIIDGEHVSNDKYGKFINLFIAFDIYYVGSKNITGFPLINTGSGDKEDLPGKEGKEGKAPEKGADDNELDKSDSPQSKKEKLILYRLQVLNSVIKSLKPVSAVKEGSKSNTKSPMEFNVKKFYSANVFRGSKIILDNIKDGLYRYITDGLIFTPANLGVASDTMGFEAPNFRTTWFQCFKWKPPEYNSIDFLVSLKKTKDGNVFEGNRFEKGVNMASDAQITKYNTLTLRVGFDEKRHGYINPCQNIIDDVLPRQETGHTKSNYKPVQFYPTNPSDDNGGITNIMLSRDKLGEYKMFTEESEEIEDNMIVEFKYEIDNEEGWRWIPMRVREDKTSELRSGINNFGNAYHTANNIWYSIHYPITEDIITSGQGLTKQTMESDVYYNKNNRVSETRALRDFHNLYVKKMLISNASSPGCTLIDYAVGKAGDLPKWINAKIAFVLGIDLSRDNIENRLDGACARYLNSCKKFKTVPKVMFLNGNSSVNIKNGDAFSTEKSRQIMKAVVGEGTKDESVLGRGVYNSYGVGKDGFTVSSIQFAIHYMFENHSTLHNFIKNVSDFTQLNGYFIGTCYDGKTLFNMLNSKSKDESTVLYKNGEKIWELTKQYDTEELPDNESCLGLAIDVYQESINQVFREYLVNFSYLTRIMENYGFVLLDKDQLMEKNFKASTGMFNELFANMEQESRSNKHKNIYGNALNMSDEEKTISFLNRYFIFKKVRNINSESMKKQYKEELTDDEIDMAEKILEDLDKETKKETKKVSPPKDDDDNDDDSSDGEEIPVPIKVKSKSSKK